MALLRILAFAFLGTGTLAGAVVAKVQSNEPRVVIIGGEAGEALVLTVMTNMGAMDDLVFLSPSTGDSTQMFYAEQTPQGTRYHSDAGYGSKCLDVGNGGAFHFYARVSPCGDYAGQYWTTSPSMAGDGFEVYRNGFTGSAMCLQTIHGGRDHSLSVMMMCDALTNRQNWKVMH